MVLGESRIANSVLRMMGDDNRNAIDNYINEVCKKNFLVMDSREQINNIFGTSLDNFFECLSEDDLMTLRTWTSYNFSNINAILRNNWTYEENGLLTDEKKGELRGLADMISNVLSKYNNPQVDFITFRGTTIDSFNSYGITNLSQLESLEGKYLYDQGFVSTSLMESSSYYKRDLNNGKKYNIEIRYLISSDTNDGVLLINRDTTHYLDESEYLLDKSSLSKVIDVKVDENTNTAVLTVVLIPKKNYDLTQQRNMSSSRNK